MKVKIVNFNPDGEWLELDVVSEVSSGVFKVKVIPFPINAEIKLIREDISGYVSEVVIDWNLNVNGKDVPCDVENKARWMPIITQWPIKNPKYQNKKLRNKSIGAEIIAFAQDINNFTKNSKPISN